MYKHIFDILLTLSKCCKFLVGQFGIQNPTILDSFKFSVLLDTAAVAGAGEVAGSGECLFSVLEHGSWQG